MLLTLIFASVPFFGGTGGTFADQRFRRGMAALYLPLFVLAMAMLLRWPPSLSGV